MTNNNGFDINIEVQRGTNRKNDMTKKMSEVERQDAVSVANDEHEAKGMWPYVGAWITVVTAAPAYHGRLVAITPCDYILEDASWVVDTGRLHEYILNPNKQQRKLNLSALCQFLGAPCWPPTRPKTVL